MNKLGGLGGVAAIIGVIITMVLCIYVLVQIYS